ncbi:hypothetical protein ASG52_15855 [Methylobacterium sp. Leaf456]|nr:hypothetical protein ASG52_15855 [Methylobacterium sp. Leaf456]
MLGASGLHEALAAPEVEAVLGICGVGAAAANAVHNATDIRVRDYPITLNKLLDRMPEAA